MQAAFARQAVSLAAAAVLASCGAGTGAMAKLLGRSGGSSGNAAPGVSDVRPDLAGTKTSPLSFSFELTDTESDAVSVDVYYSVAGGPLVPALLAGTTSLDNLQTSPAGVTHFGSWDFANQLPSGGAFVTGAELVVVIRGTATQAASTPFDVGNDAPVVQITQEPTGEVSGPIHVEILVSDTSSDPVSVAVDYDRLDDGLGWRPATSLGSALTGLITSPMGTTVDFLWDVEVDEPSAEFPAALRFTPTDGVLQGSPAQTQTIAVDNNLAPVAIVNGSAFSASSDKRRGIPVPLELEDAEGDPVTLVFQWRTSTSTFPALPTDPAQIAAILADPIARRQYQVATPFEVAEVGHAIPTGPATVRLPELVCLGSVIQSEFVVGRQLQILRGSLPPSGVTPSWGSNPLSSPAATLAVGDGESVLVLDRPQAGQWRLQEIALADGASIRTLASGTQGDGQGLAQMPGTSDVLVATSLAGMWQLLHVDAAGAVTSWYATAGVNAMGDVRGLAVATPTTAAVTVSDSLLVVDRRDPMSPIERVVLSGLATPWGIAADPRNPQRLYVAEKDWVDPGTSAPDGRLIAVDTGSGTATTITVSGVGLRHPSSMALDAGGQNLCFLTDDVPGDTFCELSAVRLNGGVGGPAFQLIGTLSETSNGIATGPHSLVLVCDPVQDELAAGGGIAQTRVITGWDPVTAEATAASAFAPALMPGEPWRIEDSAEILPAGATVRRETFVWDSRDAPPAHDVVLRAVPVDTDTGFATDTGVPRSVGAGLQVQPTIIGGPPANAGVSSLVLEDIDGNGLLDVVTADTGADTLSGFLQSAPGTFPTTRDFSVTGGAPGPLQGPVALATLDADGDGDVDFAAACPGSNRIALAVQTAPLTYVVSPIGLGNGTEPKSIAATDLDGDMRTDLVAANRGSDDLQVFFQLPGGLFSSTPSLILTDPSAQGPVDVQLADLDGDGDFDLVSCNELSDTVCVFLQTAPGIFDQPASYVLGGTGLTDSPVSVAVRDLNGDGRPDIVSANRAGNSAAIFHQQSNGSFLATPSITLSSPFGPTQPSNVTAADVDADGAVDVIVSDLADRVLVFSYDTFLGAFQTKPLVLTGSGLLSDPTSCATTDLNGDGRTDLVLANAGAGNVGIFLQATPGDFGAQVPSVLLGGSSLTPGVMGVAVADIDGDADLDLVTANASSGQLSVFEQHGPSVFSSEPTQILGDGISTAGAAAVTAADLDSDGRPDVVSANAAAGTLALFLQAPAGGLPSTPSQVIGSGTLTAPVAVASADLDDDGDLDLACADFGGNRIHVFFQQPAGTFPPAASMVLGTDTETNAPNSLVLADLDRDGDVDIACASEGSSRIAVFFQTAPGTFSPTPDLVIGNPGMTPQARSLIWCSLDGDAWPDLACVSGPANSVAIFLATAPGAYPTTPSIVLNGPEVQDPSVLAAADLNRDGTVDLVAGSRGSDLLASFQQLGGAVFPFPSVGFGGPGLTDDPTQLLLADLDRDGDVDVVSVHPGLDVVALFFNSH